MLKISTDKSKGITTILHNDGYSCFFDSLSDALMYMGIMRDLYLVRTSHRPAGEPYPVRELNPGKYPIRISKKEKNKFRRRYQK